MKIEQSKLTRTAITLGVLLLAWTVVSFSGLGNPLFFPSIGQVARSLSSTLTSPEVVYAMGATLGRAIGGLVLSVILAVPIGIIFGRNQGLYQYFEFLIDFFRSIPSSALFFFFILFFGIGDLSKIAVVVYGCSLILMMHAIYGSRPTRERVDRVNMLRVFRASKLQTILFAVLPDALPSIAAGVRVCASLSLVLVIVTEMLLGTNVGLGKKIYDSYLTYKVADMYAVIIVLGVIGYLINVSVIYLERVLVFWNPTEEAR